MVGYTFPATLWSGAGEDIFLLKRWRMHEEEEEASFTAETVCFTSHRCSSSFGSEVYTSHRARQPPMCTLNLRSADKLVRARPEIALIYGVITEFFCRIDMPGCLCLGSYVWLITMKLSGLRGRQTALMLPVVWCVWWHISCSNHKSYRGMLYYTAVSSMSAHPGWESNQIR